MSVLPPGRLPPSNGPNVSRSKTPAGAEPARFGRRFCLEKCLESGKFYKHESMAETVGAIIKEWLRAHNLESKLQESTVPSYWIDIVGEAVAKHAEVERIDKGRMF